MIDEPILTVRGCLVLAWADLRAAVTRRFQIRKILRKAGA